MSLWPGHKAKMETACRQVVLGSLHRACLPEGAAVPRGQAALMPVSVGQPRWPCPGSEVGGGGFPVCSLQVADVCQAPRMCLILSQDFLRLHLFAPCSSHIKCVYVLSCSVVSNSWNCMDCNPPVPSVHGILQARVLERVAISSSRGSSRLRN